MHLPIRIFIIYLILIGLFFSLQSCADLERERVVKEKSLQYLENKYNKEFKIIKFDRHFSNINWNYSTSMQVVPEDDETLIFTIYYSAKNRQVRGDDYKSTKWYRQFYREVAAIISNSFSEHYISVSFGKELRTNLSCSDLEYFDNYSDLIKDLESPASYVHIYVGRGIKNKDNELNCFIDLCEFLSRKAFVINQVEVHFCSEQFINEKNKNNNPRLDSSNCHKQLLFKFTQKDSIPTVEDLKELVMGIDNEYVLFKENEKLFTKAQNETDKQKAVEIYKQIISSVSKYRFNLYMPSQSAFSIESAYQLAELLEQENKPNEAIEYYQFIVDYFAFEHPRQLREYYENAKDRLEKGNGLHEINNKQLQ